MATEMDPTDPDQPERLASLIVGSVLVPGADRT
jgi:hypothetical protein